MGDTEFCVHVKWSPEEAKLLRELVDEYIDNGQDRIPWTELTIRLNSVAATYEDRAQRTVRSVRNRGLRMRNGINKQKNPNAKIQRCSKCGQPRAGHVCGSVETVA